MGSPFGAQQPYCSPSCEEGSGVFKRQLILLGPTNGLTHHLHKYKNLTLLMPPQLPPSPPLRAVTFDLDGLMFNSEELYHEVGATLLSRRGKQITGELLDQMMGRQAHAALGVMIDWHQLTDTPEQLAAES